MPLTTFIGRVGELGELVDLLGRARLVTLAGAGGAGKTRLSLAAADRVAAQFADGAWFVDLTPVRDPALVAQAVAAGVGLDLAAVAGTGRPLLDAVCDQLSRRRAIVVLDNCEQVVEAAAHVAHRVLTSCAGITVLATSRETLGVAGESVLRVGPLGLPAADAGTVADVADSDAVRLFSDRARESNGSFALSDANAAAVARICRRLDGSPLALELAASRTRLLSAHQIAERLDDRFALLGDGPRTADPRHQTLQATIDWSHDLLSERERVVLRRLAVFPADFDLAAAEAVTSMADYLDGPKPAEVLALIGRLADKSLVMGVHVEEDLPVRYRLLESVRQYATERLADAGETDVVRRRHRDFFAALGEWVYDGVLVNWLRRAEVETENLRSAMVWSHERGDGEGVLSLVAQQYVYWWFSGQFDAVEWTERAVAVPGPGHLALRVHARLALAYALLASQNPGSMERFDALVAEALALALEGGDEVMLAWTRAIRTQRETATGRFATVDEVHVELATNPGLPMGLRAMVSYEAATASLARADLDRARQWAHAGLELIGGGDSYFEAQTSAVLALIESAAGDAEAGMRHAATAVRAARRSPGTRVRVMALIRAAEAAVMTDLIAETYGPLDEALATLREMGGAAWAAEALELSAIVLAPERPEAAATLLGAAIALRGLLREEEGVLAVLARRLHDCRDQVHAALGPAEAEACERRGATMHLADVLALARGEVAAAGASQG